MFINSLSNYKISWIIKKNMKKIISSFSIDKSKLSKGDLKYNSIKQWDPVGHII